MGWGCLGDPGMLLLATGLPSVILLPLQGTKVERVIPELFEGHTHMIIECINVDCKSSRKETFMDLQVGEGGGW